MSPKRLVPITLLSALALGLPLVAPAAELASVVVRASTGGASAGFDGVVEAVRQTVVAAQVAGAVVQLDAKVGERVAAGQVLLRLDARAAEQNAAASDAQVRAARAQLEVASKDFERQQQLFRDNYISRAALERVESAFKSTQAQVGAQLAQAGAARTESGLHTVRAPFAGVIAELPVSLGDMAMPGRALLTIYDPASLRVTAAVPQSLSARAAADAAPRIELPGLAAASAWVTPQRVQWLPTVDAATHTVQLRAELPAGLAGVVPGMYARLWLAAVRTPSVAGAAPATLSVPAQAIVRRAEMTGLYVLDPAGRPVLRQVRLGRAEGDQVDILAGVTAGERVATDPQAAARVR